MSPSIQGRTCLLELMSNLATCYIDALAAATGADECDDLPDDAEKVALRGELRRLTDACAVYELDKTRSAEDIAARDNQIRALERRIRDVERGRTGPLSPPAGGS